MNYETKRMIKIWNLIEKHSNKDLSFWNDFANKSKINILGYKASNDFEENLEFLNSFHILKPIIANAIVLDEHKNMNYFSLIDENKLEEFYKNNISNYADAMVEFEDFIRKFKIYISDVLLNEINYPFIKKTISDYKLNKEFFDLTNINVIKLNEENAVKKNVLMFAFE